MPGSRGVRAASIGLLVVLWFVSWVHQDHYDLQNDDAYISYRYAANWARGLGPVYNSGERVEGYTNFLWVAFLALAARAGADVVTVSRNAGMVACWLLLVLAYRCTTVELGRSRLMGFGVAAALALHGALAANARSGLETLPLACVVLAAQVALLAELRRGRRHWTSGLLYGIASLIRADGILFVVPAVQQIEDGLRLVLAL